MNRHFEDALNAIAAATNQADLTGVYASHIARLILNGATRDQLEQVTHAWQRRALQILNEQMGDRP